jgi:sec-independent protein translocase protein TatC
MATALKPIGHEERLSVVDHLDELRSRLILCVVVIAVAFGICFWQSHALLGVLNAPLKASTPTAQKHPGGGRLAQAAAASARVSHGLAAAATAFGALAHEPSLSPATRAELARAERQVNAAARALPQTTPARVPITTGVGEPFTATLTVVAYFALLFSLPFVLYQAYAFVLPAFDARERRIALPLMLLAPLLFVAGVVFAYELVLPPAISFLQNFNDQDFDVLIQAKGYYSFALLTLLSIGLVFQLPLMLLGLNAAGFLSARRLRQSWRYVVVAIAVLAALLPGVDPVTTTIEMVPLLLLYGLSILLLEIADRRRGKREVT